MPFVSQAQRGFMYANHPEIAKEFEAHTPAGAKLPYHVASQGGKSASPAMHRQKKMAQMLRGGQQ